MFIKIKKILLLLLIFIFCEVLISCKIPDAYYFQEGVYKCEDVEVILYEDVIITGTSLEFKRIDKAESNINTLRNFKNDKEYEVKLFFIINDEEVQCDFTNKNRASCQPDAYQIEADVSKILNIPNTVLSIVLELNRIDDLYGKDRRATRICFIFKNLSKDEKSINRSLYDIFLDLDYVNDENNKIEV